MVRTHAVDDKGNVEARLDDKERAEYAARVLGPGATPLTYESVDIKETSVIWTLRHT